MMKKLLVLIAFCTAGFAAQAQETVRLEKPVSAKTVVKFMFRNGSISDPAGKEGLTALTATLIAEGGTSEYTKSEIDEMIYPMAARYGASVDKEVSVFTFAFPAAFSEDFYPVMTGLILTPAFSQEDFERVKSNQLNYVEQVIKASSDEDYSKMALENLLFRGSPYQHMVAGTVEGVQSITLEDVRNHYNQYFTRNNLLLGIAGNFSDEFVQQLEADAAKLPDRRVELPETPRPEMPDGVEVEIIEKDDALGSAIFAGFPINITRENDEFAALMLANSWLGEHRKSYGKLYQEIRETRSMNYGDYTYIEWYQAGGQNQLPPPGVPRSLNYFALWIRPVQIGESLREQYEELEDVEIGHAHFALRLAVREIDSLVENGLSQIQFETARDFLKSYIKLYIQSPERELGFLMDSRFYNRQNYIEELSELLDEATLEDVNAAVRKYLQVENMYVAIVTDDSEAQALAESLRQNKPSPMSYSDIVREGLPQEVLEEDRQIATYPLSISSVEIIDSEEMFLK